MQDEDKEKELQADQAAAISGETGPFKALVINSFAYAHTPITGQTQREEEEGIRRTRKNTHFNDWRTKASWLLICGPSYPHHSNVPFCIRFD